jgi:AcrR family transcriptional regulator
MLAAADALFADGTLSTGEDALAAVSMDDIAAAAGVGKGTLFRAFGSRDGLLDALFAERMARLRAAVEEGAPPLGPQAPPRERLLAVLGAILAFKLENAPLIRAREIASSGVPQSGQYRWMHRTLRDLIEHARSGGRGSSDLDAGYGAHVLLNALRPDLIDELLASGSTPDEIASAQAALARRILG